MKKIGGLIRIDQWAQSSTSSLLKQLLEGVAQQQLTDAVLKATLPLELQRVCRVLRCKDDKLLIACHSAHWFRHVHALKDDLLQSIRKLEPLKGIRQIEIRVVPDWETYLNHPIQFTQPERAAFRTRRNRVQFLKLQRLVLRARRGV